MSYTIKNSFEKAALDADFTHFIDQIYKKDPNYTVQSFSKIRAEIERLKPDSFQSFAVLKNGKLTAFCVAMIPEKLVGLESAKSGLIGYFEAKPDSEAVKILLDTTCAWLKEQGMTSVIGPMNGDTWHKYRFVTDFYDRPFFLSEPYNLPYYPQLWEKNGFKVDAGYYSKYVDDLAPILPRMRKFYDRTLRNGFTYRPFNPAKFEDEIKIIYRISCDAFAGNHLYKEISEPDFLALYQGAVAVIDPTLIWFCLDPQGQPCGFVFGIPDLGEAVRCMAGKSSLWAKLKFLWHKRQVKVFNFKTIGTLQSCRNSGVGPGLTYKLYESAQTRGYNQANLCLIHESNVSGKLDGDAGEVMRRYALFRKSLS